MKFKLRKPFLTTSLITLTPAISMMAVSCNQKVEDNKTSVIWIGIDGFSANVWKKHPTPNIAKLLTNSNYSLDAQDIMPSKTYPNWTALFTSMNPDKTGIEANPGSIFNSKIIKHPTKYNNEGKGVAYSIFDAIKDQTNSKGAFIYPLVKDFNITKIINQSAAKIYFAEGKTNSNEYQKIEEKIKNKKISNSSRMAYILSELTDYDSVSKAGDFLINQKSNFTFSYVTGLDIRGHAFGWGSDEYIEYMNKIDTYIGDLIKRLKKQNVFKNTIFVLTSDHGGIIGGKTHGGKTPDETTVPIIIHNANQTITHNLGNISNLDVTPTLVKLLNLKPNIEWEGKPLSLK